MKTIKRDIKQAFNRLIQAKIQEVKENGDGEVPNSAYWQTCGLYDSMAILDKALVVSKYENLSADDPCPDCNVLRDEDGKCLC